MNTARIACFAMIAAISCGSDPDSSSERPPHSSSGCPPWGAAGGDPSRAPLYSCDGISHVFRTKITQDAEEGVVTVSLEWCEVTAHTCNYLCTTYGGARSLTVEVVGDWAQVIETSYPCGSRLTVKLQTGAGATGGDLHATGAFVGLDQCKKSLSCPIDSTYRVSLGDAGVKVELVE